MNDELFDSEFVDGDLHESGFAHLDTGEALDESRRVICLGTPFGSDAERRVYFLELLRKKLPDLRKLEGFPIGEDEDILRLSDPPYYTACPNPWLNEIVAEWRAEKIGASTEKTDSLPTEPYAADVSEGKNNPVYNAHSYHTKVPHPAIMRYILHYTAPGDIVLDGFAGTGMTGVAAQLCADPDPTTRSRIESEFKEHGHKPPRWGPRHAICGDLSPVASFIASVYNAPTNLRKAEIELKNILAAAEMDSGWLYTTSHVRQPIAGQVPAKGTINYVVFSDVFVCASCGERIVFWNVAVNPETGEVKDSFKCDACGAVHTKRSLDRSFATEFDAVLNQPVRIAEVAPVLINYSFEGKRYDKIPDVSDLEQIRKIDDATNPFWFPELRMPEGDESRRNDEAGITHTHQFFTSRNLWALASIFEKSKSPVSILFFTGTLPISSKQSRFRYDSRNPENTAGGTMSGTLYIPSLSREGNVFSNYTRRSRSILSAIASIGAKGSRPVIQTASAHNQLLDSNTVDYIFTDPPFGANIMYSELNFIWESWLRVWTNILPEAIESRTQRKDLLQYQAIMLKCFQEYYRVLKSGRWMTVEFSNTGAAVWNGIQTSLQRAGFIIGNVSALDKKQGSFKAVTTPTAVRQDLVISCYKPTDEFDKRFQVQSGEVNVWDFLSEHLTHLPVTMLKEGSNVVVIERTPKVLYDRLVSFYLMRNLSIPLDAAEFHAKLRTKFSQSDGMVFTPSQLVEYEATKKKLGITKQLSLFLDVIYTESEAVEWLKQRLVAGPLKYQDIQPEFRKANAATRKGEKVIELRTILDENFIEEDGGFWRTPDINELKDRETLRTKSLYKEFASYVILISGEKPKKLKDVRLDALRIGFRSLWEKKDFQSLVKLADLIPQNLLLEDEMLLTYYDIAKDRV